MTKQPISLAELTFLITEEMAKCGRCDDKVYPDIYWHHDYEGYDWDVDILGDCHSDAEVCDNSIQEAVQVLRAKYTLIKPE